MITVDERELHLWVLRLPATDHGPAPMAAWELDARELRRSRSIVRTSQRLGYVASHIALRRLLSAYTGIPAGQLKLRRTGCPHCGKPHGRPALDGSPVPLHFSLSHSAGVALVGVAAARVGVDVQKLPPPETAELCLTALHPGEQAELRALPAGRRTEAFARIWTRKEAYLKGLGTGLCRGAGVDYLGEGDGGDRGGNRRAGAVRPPGWQVASLPARPGHAAATALETAGGHCTTVRRLPAACLYGDDATEVLAEARHQVCTRLPVPAR
ncbi:4'-phosphopantetheinyl transferase family protein [Streptomyces sp. NPDC001315]|uniref:4'-phosphopantetheinyl transferase family protein n=1 Tax=Streptomyces sp. NPDC001315 TaxID=3364562 RepID=UPI0036D19503